MKNFDNLWRRLTDPRTADDDEARQEYMTKVILVILNIVGLGLLIGLCASMVIEVLNLNGIIATIVVDMALLGSWWLADKGYWRIASYILPLIFLLLALHTNYLTGVGTMAMLQYAIVVLLTAMLQKYLIQILMLFLSICAYLSLGWLHSQRLIPFITPIPENSFAFYALTVSSMLIFIMALQWFYTRQFRRAMRDARVYANELAAHQVGLKQAVADRTAELQREVIERERLQQEIIETQQQAIAELSTPVIPLMEGIIVLPLIGSIDSRRAGDITRNLLAGIGRHRAKVVILDVTGVSLMDTGVVNYLNKTIQAARLKGAHAIVTGISDRVAEAIVDLGLDWSNITTLSDLQTGLGAALTMLGVKLSQIVGEDYG